MERVPTRDGLSVIVDCGLDVRRRREAVAHLAQKPSCHLGESVQRDVHILLPDQQGLDKGQAEASLRVFQGT